MTPAPDRRRGFTMVELLVTIALITALAALTAGAIARVRLSQQVSTTESTIIKLNGQLERKWTAVLDTAREDFVKGRVPGEVLTYAGGDRDRAVAIWAYAKLKNEFPTTVEEALGDVCPNAPQLAGGDTRRGVWLWSPSTMTSAVLILPARNVFGQLPAASTFASQEEQSAACGYAILSWTATRGEEPVTEGLQNQISDLSNGARVFKDAWGKPIAFFRQSYTSELNGPPYTQAPVNRDLADPQGKLLVFTGGWDMTKLNDLWPRVITSHAAYTGLPTASYPFDPAVPPATPARPWNWAPTFLSGGPNKAWDGHFNEDNLVGFRLRREGNKGN